MSRSCWSVIIICGLYFAYGAVVSALWLAGGPTPPAVINSIVVAAAVLSAVLSVVQILRHGNAEVAALAARVAELERAPQRVYIVSVRRPKEPQQAEEEEGEGLGPQAIETLRWVNRRLGGLDE